MAGVTCCARINGKRTRAVAMAMAVVTGGICLRQMKLVADPGRDGMAGLAHAGVIGRHVVFGRWRSKEHPASVTTHVPSDQPDVGGVAVAAIHVGPVAIRALDVLAATVVGDFSGMTVRADIYAVGSRGASVRAQQAAVRGFQVW